MGSSRSWNRTVCALSCGASFTQRDVDKIHRCRFVPSEATYCRYWRIFHGGRCDHVLTLPPAAGGLGCIQFPRSMMNMQGVGHPEPHFTLASTLRKELISSRILKCEDRVRRRWCPRGDGAGGRSPRGRQACCSGSLSSWLDSGLKSHRDYRLRSNSYEIPRKSKMVETEGRAWVVRRLRTRM